MGCTGCCSFPHGGSTAWIPLFTIIAYVLAINASYGCFLVFVTVPTDGSWDEIPGLDPKSTIGFGLFSYESPVIISDSGDSFPTYSGSGYSCTPWGTAANDILDGVWQMARAFGVIGNICLFIGMIFSIAMMCMSISKVVLKTVSGLLLLGSVAELLTYVVFASDVCSTSGCEFGPGAGLAIGSSILAFISAIFMHHVRPSNDDFTPGVGYYGGGAPAPGGQSTVTVETTIDPDGTKTTVTTTIHPDGSKTVEEAVEKPIIASAY